MENENKVIITKEMMEDLIKLNKVMTGLQAYITPEGNVYVYNPYNTVLLTDCCTNGTGEYITFNLSKFIRGHKIKTPEELILMFRNEMAGKFVVAASYGGTYLYVVCDIGTRDEDDKSEDFRKAFSGVAGSCGNTVTKETMEKFKNLLPFMRKDAKFNLQRVFLKDGIMASTDAYSMLCYEGVEFNGVPAEGFALEKTAVEVIVKLGCVAFSISQNKDFTYVANKRFTLSSYNRKCNMPKLEGVTASKDKCDRTADASSLVSFLNKEIRTIEERGLVKFSKEVEILDVLKRQTIIETFEFDGLGAEFYIRGGHLKKVIPFLKNRKEVRINYTADEYTPVNFSFDGGRVYIVKERDIEEY